MKKNKKIKLTLNAEKIRTINGDLARVAGAGLCSTTVRQSQICASAGIKDSCDLTCGADCTSSTTFLQ